MFIGFERIFPTPEYPAGKNVGAYLGLQWRSRAGIATEFRTSLKHSLRIAQKGRCCYCRRRLGDERDTELEHFLEKAEFPQYTYEIRNIGLSCSTCNGMKNSRFLRISNHLTRKAAAAGAANPSVLRSPVVSSAPIGNFDDANSYRWVHPHFDNFTDHIVVHRSWIYVGKTAKGRRSIGGMKLNALAALERRAVAERLMEKKGTLSFTVGLLSELGSFKARTIAEIASAEIRRRKSAGWKAV